jgi:phage terminase small subunit
MADLTDRRRRFAEEYCVDRNCTQAAVRAGYSPKAATSIGSYLAKQPDIRAEIDQLLAKQRARTAVTAERVIQELARIGFADARTLHRPDGTLKPPSEWDDDTAAQIAGIEVSRTSTRTSVSDRSARMMSARSTQAAIPINTGTGDMPGAGMHDSAGAEVEVTEQTVKVRRHDKVKALDILARHTGVLAGTGPGASTVQGIDPVRAARMSDEELTKALDLARQLAALVTA